MHAPPRTPTLRVGKRRLMSPILPVYGGILGRIFARKVPSDRLFGDGGRIYKGVVVGNDRTFRGVMVVFCSCRRTLEFARPSYFLLKDFFCEYTDYT